MGHVGQELRLVPRGQRQLARLLLDPASGDLDLAVLELDAPVLILEQAGFLFQLHVGLPELLLSFL